jgi:hypothetical protein
MAAAAAQNERLGLAAVTAMVALGALLLFGMEPLVGRLLVPYFGGAVHVWLICLMFFQAMLFLGYAYAHVLARRLGRWHLLLLLLPLVNLPLGIAAEVAPDAPMKALVLELITHVALPFGVLATTAVTAQTWMSHSALGRTREAYPLYAPSNAGALVALIGYPFLVEPLFGLRMQSLFWTTGYLLYAVVVGAAWFSLRPDLRMDTLQEARARADAKALHPGVRDYALWLVLAAVPSGFLLAVTNVIATEMGSFPMVWALPLGLYLGTFIVAFRDGGGVPRRLAQLWPETLMVGTILYLWPAVHWVLFVLHLVVLWVTCLLAHGELYERRPHPRWLTHFYLTLALGGWLGGALVAFGAPVLLSGLYEYPILLGCFLVLFLMVRGAPVFHFWRDAPLAWQAPRAAVVAILGTVAGIGIWAVASQSVHRHRSFYGIYRVIDEPPSDEIPGGLRRLHHGSTIHGTQLLDPAQRHKSTAYYWEGGAIAQAYSIVPAPRKLAVLGLGAGVVAAYTDERDILDFYEIDPDNELVARQWFTYLDDTEARVTVHVGDGRLGLVELGESDYDLIHMDAFSGDGIPAHLLTKEAITSYQSRLAPDGILVFHISNRSYDLRPVVRAGAKELGLHGVVNIVPKLSEIEDPVGYPSRCVVLARDPSRLQGLRELGWVELDREDGRRRLRVWTDDYVNLLGPLLIEQGWL